MINILLTSASRKVSIVRAFRQALAEQGGILIAVDHEPLAPALYAANVHYQAPHGETDEFLQFILDICKRHKVNAIVPTRDEELPWFAAHRAVFKKHGIIPVVSDLETIRICQDKHRFSQFCLERGFAIPPLFERSAFESKPHWPVFIRSARGKASQNARRVDSLKGYQDAMQTLPDPIIQQCMDAPEYSIDLFADFEGRVISAVPRQRIKIVDGESMITRTVDHAVMIEEAIRLSQALNLTAHNTLQCFLHENKMKWIEVNPRFGGAVGLSFHAGALTPRYLISILEGKHIPSCLGQYKKNLIALRYTDDIFLETSEVGLA